MMSQAFPEPEGGSEYAREGTVAHALAERMILSAARAGINRPDNDGSEMYKAASIYADDVYRVMNETKIMGGDNFYLEQQVAAPEIHPLCFGTVDCAIFDKENLRLHIWDFKYGYAPVDAYRNLQLIIYAVGILSRYDLGWPTDDLHIVIDFNIVQPRAFKETGAIDRWKVPYWDLRGIINRIKQAADECVKAGAEVRSGSHCRYCPAMANCPAALKAGVGLFEVAQQNQPVDLRPDQTALMYDITSRAIEHLKYLQSAYEEKLKHALRSGSNVPGWRLKETYGRETWQVEPQVVIDLTKKYGVDLSKLSILTPAQLRKAGVPAEVIKPLIDRPNTGFKLNKCDPSVARKVFSV
jgi:hypothetical protein